MDGPPPPETVPLDSAPARWGQIVARVEAGEEVTLVRGATPVARLVPMAHPRGEHPAAAPPRRVPGRLKGLGSAGREAAEPWTEDDLGAWEDHPALPPRA